MRDNYYSENWYEATEKFRNNAEEFGDCLQWCVSDKTKYDIPYALIGNGPHKVVINSGVHGIEGYFGSAAQNMFLTEFVPFFDKNIRDNYTIVLVHVINGWGMQNRMREVRDFAHNGALVDLNRNFGVDFTQPDKLPQNPKYDIAHDLLLSTPDEHKKMLEIKKFRAKHLHDGVWAAISNGQYKYPYGLFYGGCTPMAENKMTLDIYDKIMTPDTKSLTSVGLHTGLGRFWRKAGRVTGQMLVSHPSNHENTKFFHKITPSVSPVVPDENAVNGPTILGDLVDCLENRYINRNIPIRTADFEIGTGEFPKMSPIFKRMDMGDARYDLLHYNRINLITWEHLTESWYPSDSGWRQDALNKAESLFNTLLHAMQTGKIK
ncbi:MAG: DUF2817 domain-containing protein [Alphaproteobacteria bacterium]|nr:DUF2817 domain-containing protein [Alphaproteobacteria bacterium]